MTIRSKTGSGKYREKRRDTLVRTVEKKYGVELNSRSDAQLHTVLKKYGASSLSGLIKKVRR